MPETSKVSQSVFTFYFLCLLPIAIIALVFGLTLFRHYALRPEQCNAVFDVKMNPSYQVEMKAIPTQYWNTYYKPQILEPLALRDFWIASSYRSYQPCGGTGDVVSYKTLQMVLQKGARALHLDIWSSTPFNFYDDSAEPVVRNETMMQIFGKALKFDKCMRVIADHAWTGNNYPLIIYLEFHEPAAKNRYVLRKVAQSMAKYFATRVLPPQYGFCRVPVGDVTIKTAMGKVIFITNEYPLEGNLNELLNGVISKSKQNTGKLFIYTKDHSEYGGIASTDRNTENIKSFNQTHLSMVIPEHENNPANNWDPKIDLHNPDPEDCWQHGFQLVFMNYQLYDDNMKEYIKNFKEVPFVIKTFKCPPGDTQCDPDQLRWIPKPVIAPEAQSEDASYAPRRVNVHGNFFDHHL